MDKFKEMLDGKDVFLMDNEAEIFVWIGSGANEVEKKHGMQMGTEYAEQNSRPKGCRVTKVNEGYETAVFKANFATYYTLSRFEYMQRSSAVEHNQDITTRRKHSLTHSLSVLLQFFGVLFFDEDTGTLAVFSGFTKIYANFIR